MKKRNTFILAIACLVMVMSLFTGCSSNKGNGDAAAGDQQGNAASTDSKEKKMVRYVMPGVAPQDQAMVEEAINKKLEADGLNLTYKAIYIPWDVWDQKTNLMMSTGEEFELIHIMHDMKTPDVLASNGGIIPIDKYLDEYGPELKKSMPDWIWDTAKVKGETIFVPNFWLDTAYAEGMVTFRKDLLDKNNIPAPTSPEELLNVSETLQKNWPDDNKKVYIRVLPDEPTTYLHTTYETFPFTIFQNLIYIDQQGNVKSWLETEEFKKDATYFREAYTRGLINPDILTLPVEVANREETQGRFLYREGEAIAGSKKLSKDVPGAELDLYYLKDQQLFRPVGVRNSNGVSATSPHPEAAIEFLNWVFSSQDNFDLVLYGIKDTHWKDTGKNSMEILKKDANGAQTYSLAFWMLGNLEMNRWDVDTHPKFVEMRTKVADDAINSITLGFNFDASPVAVEYANCMTELKTSMSPIKLGLLDYDKAFPEAIKKMKAAGLDKVVAEYESQFKEWLAASGK
ncbi:extracellular solute-binding protein [Paenibacillus marinisediminis]